MKILITNDDGIHSPVLPLLATWAQIYGDVTVVAPKVEQSAKSQAIDIRNAVEVKRVDIGVDAPTYAMDSTPADCVRFGVLGLGVAYDLVISGINRGYNVGDDIAYSGTVGAILEGARLGLPGLAISTSPEHLIQSAAHLDTVYDYIKRHDLYAQNGLYNVNIPPKFNGSVRITRQGGMFFSDAFENRGEDMYMQVGEPVTAGCGDPTVDIDAILEGCISISPLTNNKTNFPVFHALQALNKA